MLDKARASFLSAKLTDKKHGWKSVKQYNGHFKSSTPSKIKYNAKIINSPKAIAEVANVHFLEKVNKLNQSLKDETRDPIKLLSKLIPRKSSNCAFSLKEITMRETFKILNIYRTLLVLGSTPLITRL